MANMKVAVSGITGFVGAQVAHDLLQKGYTVHGTARRNTPEKIAHLTKQEYAGTLVVFEADLVKPKSFDEAVVGCDYAIHVASPFASNVTDAQKELVDPAVKGTLNFLQSCKKANVKKVVVTSSLAAIADGGVHGKIFDENDWNDHSSLKFLPYYYSKVAAERAAWKFVDEEAPGMKLVVVNPVIVLGSSLVKSQNESASLLTQTVNGDFYGILDLSFPVVDVKDVSAAHIKAMESEAASGRYICYSGEMLTHREIVEMAIEFGFKPPTKDLSGKAVSTVMKFASYLAPGKTEAQYTRNHVANPIIPTNRKIVRDLDMKFVGRKEMLRDTFESLIRDGHLPDPQTVSA